MENLTRSGRALCLSGGGCRAALFHLGAEGYSLGLCEEVISQIRTDLDRFTAAEFEVLVNHGCLSCATP